jgi:hypothetical protein
VFDKKMPGYSMLAANIDSLTAQADINCTIDAISATEVDWYMQVRAKQENGPTERRRETVILAVQKIGGKWKITQLKPLSILAPMQVAGTH